MPAPACAVAFSAKRKPFANTDNEELFTAEREDLFKELRDLPRYSAIRKARPVSSPLLHGPGARPPARLAPVDAAVAALQGMPCATPSFDLYTLLRVSDLWLGVLPDLPADQ